MDYKHMSHQSEQCIPLRINKIKIDNYNDINNIGASDAAVWFFILPYGHSSKEINISKKFLNCLEGFIHRANNETVLCFLASTQTSAELMLNLQEKLHYKLWVSVKYEKPVLRKGHLSNNHCALLILCKYKGNLRHTKTRIAYTYCPACDKTTKDYGGKKHTYHEYGTLMSDVWRDICASPKSYPNSVVERLKDVFGLPPYKELFVIDIRKIFEYKRRASFRSTYDLTKTNKLNERFHNILLNGDCSEILEEIPSNSID